MNPFCRVFTLASLPRSKWCSVREGSCSPGVQSWTFLPKAAQSGPTLRTPQGQHLCGALGPSHQGQGHLCPLPCNPPQLPRLGLSHSLVPLCPHHPFSAQVPCPSPMPSRPPSRLGEAGSRCAQWVPAPPTLPTWPLLTGSKRGQPGGPGLLSPFWNLPALLLCPRVSCDHAQKQGGSSHWARPKICFRGHRAEGVSGQRMGLSVTTRKIAKGNLPYDAGN